MTDHATARLWNDSGQAEACDRRDKTSRELALTYGAIALTLEPEARASIMRIFIIGSANLVDISRATQALRWSTRTSLEQGLAATLAHPPAVA